MKNKTLILLSTYNGEKYLKEQLDSLVIQNNVDILIRDDGSTDKTIEILENYSKIYSNISFWCGENVGYAKSFWILLKQKKDYKYYAFCDQDDIWEKDKIQKAIEKIECEKENLPILYTSNVKCIDNNLEIIKTNYFESKILSKYESLQKSILPGCTFVFNNKAQNLLSKYDGYMESHDWAAYIIISYFGKVLYDSKSYINYRIHEDNTLGIQNKFEKIKSKVLKFFRKSKCTRSTFAQNYYETFSELFDISYKKNVEALAYYKKDIRLKWRVIRSKDFKGFIFKLYIILNRV